MCYDSEVNSTLVSIPPTRVLDYISTSLSTGHGFASLCGKAFWTGDYQNLYIEALLDDRYRKYRNFYGLFFNTAANYISIPTNATKKWIPYRKSIDISNILLKYEGQEYLHSSFVI